MATPHISAEPGDIAPGVLMPGDPRRAKRMADLILDDVQVVSDVRGIQAFTGVYNGDDELRGRRLSIMASGMGMPSIGLYATELFKFFGVERICRVGTAGGISSDVNLGDVIIAVGAHTTSSMNELRIPGTHFSAVADFGMAARAWAKGAGDPHVVAGSIISADHFYFSVPGQLDAMVAHGVFGVEMEAASLYGVAAEYGKAGLAVLTISDHLRKPEQLMTATERETLFEKALALAVPAVLG